MKKFMPCLALALVLVLTPVASAHEGDYVHMPVTSGGIVSINDCGYHVSIGVDDNDDGTVDRCLGTFVYHDMLHVIPTEFKLYNGRMGCGCEALTLDNGGVN
jgi:hypothetical protein